jgi:hypothetical protein
LRCRRVRSRLTLAAAQPKKSKSADEEDDDSTGSSGGSGVDSDDDTRTPRSRRKRAASPLPPVSVTPTRRSSRLQTRRETDGERLERQERLLVERELAAARRMEEREQATKRSAAARAAKAALEAKTKEEWIAMHVLPHRLDVPADEPRAPAETQYFVMRGLVAAKDHCTCFFVGCFRALTGISIWCSGCANVSS